MGSSEFLVLAFPAVMRVVPTVLNMVLTVPTVLAVVPTVFIRFATAPTVVAVSPSVPGRSVKVFGREGW